MKTDIKTASSTKQPHQKTQRELADDYSVSERTIRNWEHDGAPLDDPKEMVRWLNARRDKGESGKLPEGFEHANVLRHLCEQAAGHFLNRALERIALPLVAMLEEERGLTRHQANGTAIVLHHMLVQALNAWTAENQFGQHVKQRENADLDQLMGMLVPDYRGRSLPQEHGYQFPMGPALQTIYLENGGPGVFEKLASMGIHHETEGSETARAKKVTRQRG